MKLRAPSRQSLQWITEVLVVRRWQAVAFAALLGLCLSAVVYVGKREADHAAEQRQQLAAQDERLASAIKRLANLEHPSVRERRKQINRLLRVITPQQAANLGEALNRAPAPGASPPSNTSPPPQGHVSPPGTRPGGGGGGGNGGDGNPLPPVVPPSPPQPEPPLIPQLDFPPVDIDGDGPLPPIDLPPLPRGLVNLIG